MLSGERVEPNEIQQLNIIKMIECQEYLIRIRRYLVEEISENRITSFNLITSEN